MKKILILGNDENGKATTHEYRKKAKAKITELENLCLKCDGGIIKRIIKEKDDECEVEIKKCSNKNCKYQYGIKEFSKDYAPAVGNDR